jgi:DNA-directed RNA polymerase specialized sigma24 family protein
LYEVLDGLSERYRTALILFELEGLSGEQIAAITDTTVANVWIRLFRGRRQFMHRLMARERKDNP